LCVDKYIIPAMLAWYPIGPVPMIPLVNTKRSEEAPDRAVAPVLLTNSMPNAFATSGFEASVAM
jgi:hypothetical protein